MSNALDLYFILGQGKEDISEETKIFDDIVVGDFIDSYRNLTLKTLTAHTFLNSTYFDACKASQKWVIFHDDDSYVDYRQVFDQKVASNGLILKNSIFKPRKANLSELYNDQSIKTFPDYSVCGMISSHRYHLGTQSMESLWTNTLLDTGTPDSVMGKFRLLIIQKKYPRRPCAGMSRETSSRILDQAQKTGLKQFPLEDVLFTGIFREMANITQLTRLPYVCEHYRYLTYMGLHS